MRARTEQAARPSGNLPLLLGGAFLALALLLLAVRLYGSGGSRSIAEPDSDPYKTTAGIIAFWEQRIRENPGDFVAHNNLADAYLRRARETGDVSDYGRAEAAVNASLGELPADSNYTALTLKASLDNVKHDFRGARVAAERALAIRPGDSFARSVLGDAQLALGEYDEAFATYRELVDRATSVASFSRMAHIHELRGELGAADAAWQNAFNTDSGRRPESTAWARVQYGHFLFSQGQLDRARGQYDSALEALPGYVHATAGHARLAAAQGRYDESIGLYTGVVQRQPVLEYVIALGDVHWASGQEAEAQQQYDLVTAIEQLYRANGINTDTETAVFLADHDLRPGDAVTQAKAAYEARPASITTADALSWALYKAGRADEAMAYSKQALRLGTKDPTLLFHAGMIHNKARLQEEARAFLTQALEANPNFSILHSDEAAKILNELNASVTVEP